MNKFNELYNSLIKEIKYREFPINNLKTNVDPLSELIIYEDCAFHKLPRRFADFLIKEIKDLKNSYETTKTFIKEIDLRNTFKLIDKNETNNIKYFYDFLQLLSDSSCEKILTIQLSNESSYTEPIALEEFNTNEYKKFQHNKNNAKYSYKLAKNIRNKSYSESLKIMKEYVNDIDDLGLLQIDIKEIENKDFEFDNDDTIIGHEIRHFIIFLQRWSKTNYEICNRYSNQDLNKMENDFKVYQLNENEFITLSSTYIERLINIFDKYKRNESNEEINLLIKSVLILSNDQLNDENLSDKYWINILINLIEVKSNNPKDVIQKLKVKRIIDFFKNIFDDSKYEVKKNKFKSLINWTLKSFYEKYFKDKK